MFKINHIIDQDNNINLLKIESKRSNTSSIIYLNEGASLQNLRLNGVQLINEMQPLSYSTTYASAILFPFANRIEDGSYKFNDEFFQFDINEVNLNNALHGLVYNKTFDVLNIETNAEFASVVLGYQEHDHSVGFPYTYTIQLEYILTQSSLTLKVEIKNTDVKAFPFTLGWHPYFLSSDLYNSSVVFDSNKKLKLDNRNITESIVPIDEFNALKIENKSLDDCFVLNSNAVEFKTPNYNLSLNSSEKDSFLQLYTPPHPNTIAIEPTTGVSNSFNNGIGLKKLKPQETYSLDWNLKLKSIIS